jgi:hypothetical protein
VLRAADKYTSFDCGSTARSVGAVVRADPLIKQIPAILLVQIWWMPFSQLRGYIAHDTRADILNLETRKHFGAVFTHAAASKNTYGVVFLETRWPYA